MGTFVSTVKLWGVLFIFVMTLFFLSGCSGGEENAGSGEGGPALQSDVVGSSAPSDEVKKDAAIMLTEEEKKNFVVFEEANLMEPSKVSVYSQNLRFSLEDLEFININVIQFNPNIENSEVGPDGKKIFHGFELEFYLSDPTKPGAIKLGADTFYAISGSAYFMVVRQNEDGTHSTVDDLSINGVSQPSQTVLPGTIGKIVQSITTVYKEVEERVGEPIAKGALEIVATTEKVSQKIADALETVAKKVASVVSKSSTETEYDSDDFDVLPVSSSATGQTTENLFTARRLRFKPRDHWIKENDCNTHKVGVFQITNTQKRPLDFNMRVSNPEAFRLETRSIDPRLHVIFRLEPEATRTIDVYYTCGEGELLGPRTTDVLITPHKRDQIGYVPVERVLSRIKINVIDSKFSPDSTDPTATPTPGQKQFETKEGKVWVESINDVYVYKGDDFDGLENEKSCEVPVCKVFFQNAHNKNLAYMSQLDLEPGIPYSIWPFEPTGYKNTQLTSKRHGEKFTINYTCETVVPRKYVIRLPIRQTTIEYVGSEEDFGDKYTQEAVLTCPPFSVRTEEVCSSPPQTYTDKPLSEVLEKAYSCFSEMDTALTRPDGTQLTKDAVRLFKNLESPSIPGLCVSGAEIGGETGLFFVDANGDSYFYPNKAIRRELAFEPTWFQVSKDLVIYYEGGACGFKNKVPEGASFIDLTNFKNTSRDAIDVLLKLVVQKVEWGIATGVDRPSSAILDLIASWGQRKHPANKQLQRPSTEDLLKGSIDTNVYRRWLYDAWYQISSCLQTAVKDNACVRVKLKPMFDKLFEKLLK